MRLFCLKVTIGLWAVFATVNAQAQNPDSLYSRAESFYNKAEFQKAGEIYKAAGALYLQENDSSGWVKALYRYGDALISLGKVEKGLETLLMVDEQKPATLSDNRNARLKNYIGWAYRQLEQYENSKKYYLQGIDHALATNDSVLIGRLNNNISYAYLYSGDYEKALSHQLKAKEIYESAGENYRLSFVLNGIFLTLRDLGLHEQADKYIRQSMAIRKETGNPNLMDIAYHNMALSYRDLGKMDSAIIYYQKSLELSRMLENPYDITQTLINIGVMYEYSGEVETALLYYNEALKYNRQTNRPVSIANNLMMIADLASEQQDYTTAETFFMDALALLQESSSPVKLAETYYEMADMEIDRENFERAEEYISEGYEVADSTGNLNIQSKAIRLRGRLATAKGNYEESLNHYRKLYSMHSDEEAGLYISPIIMLARAYSRVNSDSAFILADEAFQKIDSARTKVTGLTFKAGYFGEYAGFYNEVASWYITQKNDPEKAFELVEAAKARVLMDNLAEAENKLLQKLDESTLIRKQQYLKKIDRIYNQIRDAEGESQQEVLQNELKDIKFRYQTFLNEIRQKVPEWKSFKYPTPLVAEEAMALLDSETAILEYAFAKNHLIKFYITDTGISTAIIDSIAGVDAKTYFTEEIKTFRDNILNETEYVKSEELAALLLPNENKLRQENITQLVIISEGVISFLPFEALLHKGKYLIEYYNIKYLPSVSIYPFINSPHRETGSELLAVAGSGFEAEGVPGGLTRSQNDFASLPSTILEVESIAANFENPKVLKNANVTEANIKSHDIGDFRYLHFATHGSIDEVNPSQSGLILSKKKEVESLFGEDGFLNSAEIATLQLNAELVTLSACNTGMGKILTGEGLLGLQHSFLSAGSAAVVVSLWSVYDRSTADFMARFYKSMLTHKEDDFGFISQMANWMGVHDHPMFDYKAKAIREAKLAMIDHPYYNKPVHWAPFILIGK